MRQKTDVLFKDTKIFNTLLSRCSDNPDWATDERIPEALKDVMYNFKHPCKYDFNLLGSETMELLNDCHMSLPEEPVRKPVTSTEYFSSDRSDTHGGPEQKKLL